MIKAEEARKLVEELPRLSKKKLGLILFEKGIVQSPEIGRRLIQNVISGSDGSTKTDAYIGNNLKAGKKNNFTPYKVDGKNIGLLFDLHFPFHDKRAINVALSYFKLKKVDTIILGGDAVDFYGFSRFMKDPKQRITPWQELGMLAGFITDLRNNFPKAKIIWKYGNHCERFEHHVFQMTPVLADFKVLSMDHIMNHYGETDDEKEVARKRDLIIVDEKRVVKMGKLNLVHGHEFGKSIFSPVNPARGLYLRAKTNTICGHHHQTSEHIEKDLNDNVVGCWSVGCLSDLHPAYMPINKFNLGFARVVIDKEGNFSVENKKLMNYKIV